MTTEKITTRMGSTTVTQTAEGFELKNGSTINHQDEHTTFITMIGNVFVLFCPFPGLK